MTVIPRSPPAALQSVEAREALLLAPYAMHSADSAGRKFPEPAHPYRGPFQRDRDRIVHSAAYRRLSWKTQVFTGEMGDYPRTRLTHTLEVASIARTLGRALALNEDLIEALALVHDLGHPPFGHAGEDVLSECLKSCGGFSHNLHALRIVEELELRYPQFPGLNLSLEVLESQAARAVKQSAATRPILEAQVVDAADSVAYDTHDADDALELGLLELDELLEIPLWAEADRRVRRRDAGLEEGSRRRAILHELIDWQVGDLLERAARQISELALQNSHAVRHVPTVVRASQELAQQKEQLEWFLHERVYRHPRVLTHRAQAQACLEEMFACYLERPELLGASFRDRADRIGLARCVGDYLAGMTDRFVMRERTRIAGLGGLP